MCKYDPEIDIGPDYKFKRECRRNIQSHMPIGNRPERDGTKIDSELDVNEIDLVDISKSIERAVKSYWISTQDLDIVKFYFSLLFRMDLYLELVLVFHHHGRIKPQLGATGNHPVQVMSPTSQ